MAIIQEVKDGKVVNDTSESTSTNKNGKKKNVDNTMGQEQFLQLLVAQMQYQDPLEPTSNTEWVAQMATFSMVESLNNMQSAFTQQSANSLVGKYVFINDGDNGFVKGKVDFITQQNGKTMLSVNDQLYDIDKLDTVSDEEYYEGAILANDLHKMIQLLPSVDNLTVSDEGLVKSAREAYDKLTDSQKKFVQKEHLDKLRALEDKMAALKATQFTGSVNELPSVGQIEEADEETLMKYNAQFADTSKLYEGLSEEQRKKVSEKTINQYNSIKDALAAASKKLGLKPDGGEGTDDAESEVADILQKILEELQAQKNNGEQEDNSNESNGNEDNSIDAGTN